MSYVEPSECPKASRRAWRGGRAKHSAGYVLVYQPAHPRAMNRHVFEHVLVAEKALGKFLPPKAEMHHVDFDKKNNANTNLVVCPDHAYHALLHTRTEAIAACGNANTRRCRYCLKWTVPFSAGRMPSQHYHKDCAAKYQREGRHGHTGTEG